MPSNPAVTSDTFYSSALLWGAADLVLISLLVWRISPSRFRELRWPIVVTGALFWGIFSTALLWGTWDTYYRYFYPEIARWLTPLTVILYGAIALVMWWLALRLPGNPVVNLALLAGIESLLEHLWGIYGLGILDNVPMLQNASIESVLVFAFFEYALYWSVILAIAAVVSALWQRRTPAVGHASS